jgi:hypothetical protein
MSQRNPLNQRYQGDGPTGQTRKSAASVKPVSEAAASVYVKNKPKTAAERKAAEKARKAKLDQKATERARKAARAAQAARTAEAKARLARGEITEAEMVAESEAAAAAAKPQQKGFFASLFGSGDSNATTTRPEQPRTNPLNSNPEYKKWRRRYWICLGFGMFCVVAAFALQMVPGDFWIWFMVPAYGLVIAAFVIDFRKVRPFMKAQQASGGSTAGKTPKQIKHEQEAKSQAIQMEEARKAAKAAKKRTNRTAEVAAAAEAADVEAASGLTKFGETAAVGEAGESVEAAQAARAGATAASSGASAAATGATKATTSATYASDVATIGAPAEIGDAPAAPNDEL